MRRAILLAALVLLSQSHIRAAEPAADPVPFVPTNDATDVPYSGTVTEIKKESITIQFPNKKLKPKTFPVSEALAAGEIPMKPRRIPGPFNYDVAPEYMYRLTDVKVGDYVSIGYAHIGAIDTCDHICILKRPGGRVPPLPKEAEELNMPSLPSLRAKYIPYHERQNAYWDLEDKGIPYPEKFGEFRRWPIAPMPHEPKPKK